MKSSTGIIIGVLAVVLIIVGVLTYKNNDQVEDQALNSDTKGSLYVGVTDVTANIENVNDIDLEVKKVEVHNSTGGWTTISTDSKTYSLLALRANSRTEFYAQNDELEAGTYDKVRVTFGDAMVRTKTNGTIKASMPSSQMVFNTNLKVNSGQKTHLKLDILADKSLHEAKDKKYVFAPAVQAEARSNANIVVENGNVMNISGGVIDRTSNFGMDLAGATRAEFTLTTDNTLQISTPSGTTINFLLGGKTYQSDTVRVQENQWNNAGTAQINADGTVQNATDLNVNTNNNNSGSNSGTNTNTNTSGGVNLDLDGALDLGN